MTFLHNISYVGVILEFCFIYFKLMFTYFAVHGGLRCLALLSADLDDATVPKLVPVLFPVLHTIVSFPEVGFYFLFFIVTVHYESLLSYGVASFYLIILLGQIS